MKAISIPLTSDLMEDMVQPWYYAYNSVDEVMNYVSISAANFMNIEPFMDLMCLKRSAMIKGKSGDEIRRILIYRWSSCNQMYLLLSYHVATFL